MRESWKDIEKAWSARSVVSRVSFCIALNVVHHVIVVFCQEGSSEREQLQGGTPWRCEGQEAVQEKEGGGGRPERRPNEPHPATSSWTDWTRSGNRGASLLHITESKSVTWWRRPRNRWSSPWPWPFLPGTTSGVTRTAAGWRSSTSSLRGWTVRTSDRSGSRVSWCSGQCMNNLKELEITLVIHSIIADTADERIADGLKEFLQLCLKTLTDAEVVQPVLPSSNPLYQRAYHTSVKNAALYMLGSIFSPFSWSIWPLRLRPPRPGEILWESWDEANPPLGAGTGLCRHDGYKIYIKDRYLQVLLEEDLVLSSSKMKWGFCYVGK